MYRQQDVGKFVELNCERDGTKARHRGTRVTGYGGDGVRGTSLMEVCEVRVKKGCFGGSVCGKEEGME